MTCRSASAPVSPATITDERRHETLPKHQPLDVAGTSTDRNPNAIARLRWDAA
jgi:hypothetical protein